jgi:hypothetical protein
MSSTTHRLSLGHVLSEDLLGLFVGEAKVFTVIVEGVLITYEVLGIL